MPYKKPTSSKMNNVDAMSSATENFDFRNIESNKAGLKTQVELGSIKEQLSSAFKDKESRTALMSLVGIGIMAYFFKSDQESAFEEETKEEIEEKIENGELKPEEVKAVKKFYKDVEKNTDPEIEIKEPAVITSKKMRAINTRAINSKNRKKLKNKGVNIKNETLKLGSYKVVREKDLTTFDSFQDRALKVFQPNLQDNPEKQLENTARALSFCAIGIYQILPVHHFAKMGWSTNGKQGLKNMYEFIISKEKQKKLNYKILIANAKKLNGDIDAIATSYYSGKGKQMLAWKKSGISKKPKWMTRKSAYGYGSIDFYITKVRKFFKDFYGKELERVNPNDDKQMLALQKAIARKETGFSSGKKTKSKTASVEIA